MSATAPEDTPRRGFITVSVMLATIMQALDTTIANVALPRMQGTLSATQDQIAWVLTSYIVAAAIMIPPTGMLAARFGRRRLFLWSVAGFTVASMLCGAAQSLPQIVAFRILQGVFGAGLVPLSQAVLLDSYPVERHGSAMAMWGMGVMVGPILGPTLGGLLTESYNWRWVFYINAPFGLLAWLGILAFVPETERDARRGFDLFGFALLGVALGALQLMLDRGQGQDWFDSSEIVIEAVAAGLFLYMFLVHMFTHERPFIEPALFRDRNFVTGLGFIFVVGVMLLATLALMPPFLQQLMGYPVLTTGLVLAPRGMGTLVAMVMVGRLISRVDPRALIAAGLALTALSLYDMSHFTLEVAASDVVRTGVVQGLGLGLIFVPLSTTTFATLAPHLRTEGTAMFSLLRNIGSSIGISVMVTLLARGTQRGHSVLVEHVNPYNPLLDPSVLPPAWNLHHLANLAALDAEVTRQAAAIAYLDDFRAIMVLALAALPLVALLRNPRHAYPRRVTS